ncbi:MAG TPA: TadE family protein [Gemmataceae bacterium]|nr:TadE family protein [Gemmataceae bacterium]
MVCRLSQKRRRGSLSTEAVIVLPTLLFLIVATVVGGYGIFRYQQIAMLAREGARYATVHGGQYQQETGNPAATPQDIYNNAIVPFAANLDLSLLSYSVAWNANDMPYSVNTDYETPTNNTVTVTVSYKWFPEAYLIGPIVLSSTSTMPMSY